MLSTYLKIFPSSLCRGSDLHGPLVERMIELPMDIYEGRVGGEFRIKSHDYDSWYFPELFGMVNTIGEEVLLEFFCSP